VDRQAGRPSVPFGSAATCREPDLEGGELTFKMSGMKAAARCTQSRPSAVAHGGQLGGEWKIIAATLEAPVIEKMFTHLGLRGRAPPRAPARGQTLPSRTSDLLKSVGVAGQGRRDADLIAARIG
jgi:hypothetical protein